MARTRYISMIWWCQLCTRPTRDVVGFSIVLDHCNNSRRVDMMFHQDTRLWFRDNQSLLLLLSTVCSVEKQQIYQFSSNDLTLFTLSRGGFKGGGRTRRAPPLKLEKIWFFCLKSWFVTRNTPKIFARRSARRHYF